MIEQAAWELFQPVVAYPKNVHFRAASLPDATPFHTACYPGRNLARFGVRFRHSLQRQAAGKLIYLVALAVNENDRDKIVGGGKLIRGEKVFEIVDLIVAPAWRSQGIGAGFIAIMLRLARDAGASAVEIGVLHENRRARALYRRIGFVEARELNQPGKKPATILRRPLS